MWNGSAYSVSKWELIGLAKSLALQMGECNINVNVVVPRLIDTTLIQNQKRWQVAMGKGYEDKQIEESEVAEKLGTAAPLGLPWLKAEDVAPTVVFLTSDAAERITDAIYDVADGTSAINTA